MRDVGSGQTSERAGSSPLGFCNRVAVVVLSERTRLLPLRRFPIAPDAPLCVSVDVGSLCLVHLRRVARPTGSRDKVGTSRTFDSVRGSQEANQSKSPERPTVAALFLA